MQLNITINIDGKFFKKLFKRRKLIITTLAIFTFIGVAYAGIYDVDYDFKVPNEFVEKQTVSSSKINQNFQTITDKIINQAELIENLSTFTVEGGLAKYEKGMIIMWSGDPSSLPTGWALCNGDTANGTQTPNLSGRFVVGQGQVTAGGSTRTFGMDDVGGSISHTHNMEHNHTGTFTSSTFFAAINNHRHGYGSSSSSSFTSYIDDITSNNTDNERHGLTGIVYGDDNIYNDQYNDYGYVVKIDETHEDYRDTTSIHFTNCGSPIMDPSPDDIETETWSNSNNFTSNDAASRRTLFSNLNDLRSNNENDGHLPPFYTLAYIIYVGT